MKVDEKLTEDLNRIIDGECIKTVFQPIVSLRDGSSLGHEALSRMTCDTSIRNPEQLFQAAGESDRLWDLELLCRTTALKTAFLNSEHAAYEKKLFLNVNPNIMHDDKFRQGFTCQYLKQYGIRPENIIFEITERNAVADMQGFVGTVEHYKGQNYHIAVDDAGAGYSGLNLIGDIRPHYIKLDMNLIRGIDRDNIRYALVKSMVELSQTAGICLIAEGVETRRELVTLVDLGVQYAQGYFLCRPDEEIRDADPAVKDLILELNRRKKHVLGTQASNIYISNICTPTQTIPPEMKVETVFDKLKNDPDAFGCCVVKDGAVLGVVTKSHFVLQLSGRYGFSLHQNKPVSFLMDTDFLSVESTTPINAVSNAAMSRPPEKLYDFIVVTRDGKYLGTVTIKDLLQKTTEIEVVNAKYQNPLTGLPGNVLIEHKISQCLACEKPYCVIYFDIDNFKAYNDVYGFENGDSVIKLLADVLQEHLPNDQFVGHVGGDDFVAVMQCEAGREYCERVIGDFRQRILKFYNPQDVRNGYIIAENRKGRREKFPLISISAAGILDRNARFHDRLELTEELARLKKKSKQQKGDSICWL
ncbi:EAL and GGDEF domain-containing protein [Caproicibacter fermentans]|uniref:EAL and GGDEF domain-containing protein n=1 Tax=Caproicibacter fermentans TaxID=2576756 RepID=A0A7G8TG15_9FIRM|nr:EAL and GGDEF domain-containing protein [Caproicibacter fermentans]